MFDGKCSYFLVNERKREEKGEVDQTFRGASLGEGYPMRLEQRTGGLVGFGSKITLMQLRRSSVFFSNLFWRSRMLRRILIES